MKNQKSHPGLKNTFSQKTVRNVSKPVPKANNTLFAMIMENEKKRGKSRGVPARADVNP